MDRMEFLNILREKLTGTMQEDRIAAHVDYYRDYIDTEIRRGRSETEVLEELGDPRLIAKTLSDTSGVRYSDPGDTVQEAQGSRSSRENAGGSRSYKKYRLDLSSWYGKAAVILIAVLAIFLIFMIIGVLLPVIFIAAVIIFLISRFRRS